VRVFGEVPLRAPVAAVVAVGTATDLVQVSGRSYRFSSVLDMVATAYNAGSGSNGSFTGDPSAIGLPLQYGVVAVDPHVIPLGSRLYVQGYGLAVAADTGSAIVGDRIDLFFWNSPAAIAAFGIRRLKVYILDDPRLPPVPVPDAVLREFGSAKPVQPASGSGASASGPSSSGAPGASAKAA
jgi:3D (Asp-Asp-Asp) domain-containing protein